MAANHRRHKNALLSLTNMVRARQTLNQ